MRRSTIAKTTMDAHMVCQNLAEDDINVLALRQVFNESQRSCKHARKGKRLCRPAHPFPTKRSFLQVGLKGSGKEISIPSI